VIRKVFERKSIKVDARAMLCASAREGARSEAEQKVGQRLWFTIDVTKRQGRLLLLDDLSVVIKGEGARALWCYRRPLRVSGGDSWSVTVPPIATIEIYLFMVTDPLTGARRRTTCR
jgi:hypothetical protein